MRRLSGVLTALAAALVLAVSLIYDICCPTGSARCFARM